MNQNKKEFNRNWSLSEDLSELTITFKLSDHTLDTKLPSDIIFFPKKIKNVPLKTQGGDLAALLQELQQLKSSYKLELYDLNTIDRHCYFLWIDIIDMMIENILPNPRKLYFMQNQDGLIKIGISKDVRARKSSLQYQLGDKISIIKTLSYPEKEKDIHNLFASSNAYYAGGIEWFNPHPDLIKFIDDVTDENFQKLYKKLCQKNLNTLKKKS
jgi:hypothetical protein